jgi:hypothetical protein
MLIGKELFFGHGRYRLDIGFEDDPTSREGRLFRESKRIARALGQKSVPPGSFQFLDSEQLIYELTMQRGGVGITVRSNVTGEVIDRGTFIRPDRKWDVEREIREFREDTESFIQSYFGEDATPEERVIDYEKMLATMRDFLTELKKKQ